MVQDDPLRAHYVLIPAQLPADLPETRIDIDQLPDDWRTIWRKRCPPGPGAGVAPGHSDRAVLSVPSAVVPAERSCLLNPRHPDFARVVIGAPPVPADRYTTAAQSYGQCQHKEAGDTPG